MSIDFAALLNNLGIEEDNEEGLGILQQGISSDLIERDQLRIQGIKAEYGRNDYVAAPLYLKLPFNAFSLKCEKVKQPIYSFTRKQTPDQMIAKIFELARASDEYRVNLCKALGIAEVSEDKFEMQDGAITQLAHTMFSKYVEMFIVSDFTLSYKIEAKRGSKGISPIRFREGTQIIDTDPTVSDPRLVAVYNLERALAYVQKEHMIEQETLTLGAKPTDAQLQTISRHISSMKTFGNIKRDSSLIVFAFECDNSCILNKKETERANKQGYNIKNNFYHMSVSQDIIKEIRNILENNFMPTLNYCSFRRSVSDDDKIYPNKYLADFKASIQAPPTKIEKLIETQIPDFKEKIDPLITDYEFMDLATLKTMIKKFWKFDVEQALSVFSERITEFDFALSDPTVLRQFSKVILQEGANILPAHVISRTKLLVSDTHSGDTAIDVEATEVEESAEDIEIDLELTSEFEG